MDYPGRQDRPVTGGHALVVTGGPLPTNQGPLPSADLVIAADGGADNAANLGLAVDLVVGDLAVSYTHLTLPTVGPTTRRTSGSPSTW